MGILTLATIRPARGTRRWAAALVIVVLCLTLLLAFSAVAMAVSGDEIPTAAGKEAPSLDYTFSWLTFGGTFGLIIIYYVFIFRVSEKEFKKVIDAHFGPKQ